MGTNSAHLEFCASPAWRQIVEEVILPVVLRDKLLGPDVIEIGPGPGFTTDVLRVMTEHLTAVELDRDLATALRTRLAGTNVEVVVGDATTLELPDDSFSGAASFHMLHHIPLDEDQDRALSELARVLKSGGIFVAADGIENEDSRAFHQDDVYNPLDPSGLEPRLTAARFTSIEVGLSDMGWVCSAVARLTANLPKGRSGRHRFHPCRLLRSALGCIWLALHLWGGCRRSTGDLRNRA